jgi:hypothetical protein
MSGKYAVSGMTIEGRRRARHRALHATSSPWIRRVAAATVSVLALWLSASAEAQTATAGPTRTSIARTLLGDAAFAIDARSDGKVGVGVSAGDSTLVLAFEEGAVNQWLTDWGRAMADTTRPKKGQTKVLKATVEESGQVAGAMTLRRLVSHAGSRYEVFLANRTFGGFTVPLERHDTDILVAAMRKAVTTTHRMSKSR